MKFILSSECTSYVESVNEECEKYSNASKSDELVLLWRLSRLQQTICLHPSKSISLFSCQLVILW